MLLKWTLLRDLGAPPPPAAVPGVKSCERLFSATTFNDFSNTFHSLIVLSLVERR